MSKYILLLAFLAMACTKGTSQITTADFSENSSSHITEKQFAKYISTDIQFNYYLLKINELDTPFKKSFFFETVSEYGIVILHKEEFNADSAIFKIDINSDYPGIFQSLLDDIERESSTLDSASQLKFYQNSSLFALQDFQTNQVNRGTLSNFNCESAGVFCGENPYTYPAGVNSGTAEPGPYYGCLSSQPNPAWYFLQIGPPGGDVVITITANPPEDIDFACWGPFTSPTGACDNGLTQSAQVDCSYDGGTGPEYCQIYDAIEGQFYMFLLTNFSNDSTDISFVQSNLEVAGSATTNCDIVINCSVLAITANPSACSPATNTYNLTGNIEFTNPPASGTLTITDITAVPNVSQTFPVNASLNSPLPYALNNITCDGTTHTITASFSADAACNLTTTYNAPTSICPVASISGGGDICNNGTSTATVIIDLVGVGPFDFTYSFNSVPQPPVTGYNGPFPYVITTAVPGTYGLVSVSNAACPGTVSGTATITMNPLPVPTITGINNVCAGTTGSSYSTEAGKNNYVWNVPTGGTITSGQGTNTINVSWTTAGAHTVTVSYLGPAPSNCAPATPTVYNVNVAPVPAAFAGTDFTVCQGQPHTIIDATKANEASFSWQIITGLGTLTGAGTLTPTYTPTAGETGDIVLSLNVTGLSTCSPVADQVTIHILPMVTATAGADHSLCQNGTYKIMDAVAAHYSSLLWTSNGTGTLTGETTLTPTYQPGAGETGPVTVTLTAFGNLPCGNAVSQLTLTVNPAAVANAGPPDVICEGSSFILSGATAANESSLLWTRSGTGNFDNTSILNPTYIPSAADIAAGSVTLTLTANGLSGCAAAQGSVVLSISRQVILSAGSDAIVCQNNPFTVPDATEQFSTGLLWSHNGTGMLTDETTKNPTYTPGPGDNGIVTLTLTGYANAPCGTVTDALALTVNLPATADAGPAATICEGSTFTLSGSNATNMVSLLWSTSGSGSFDNTSILHPIYTPTAADISGGSVTLTLTATGYASCSAVSSQVTLNISRQVIVNAGPDHAICQNTTFTVTGASEQHSTSLLWSHNGSGLISDANTISPTYIPAAGESGIVTLTLTGDPISPCGNDIDQMQVTIHPLPIAFAGLSGTSCQGNNYTINDATAQFHSSVSWIEDGPGNLVNANTLSPTYIPLPSETGTVTLTLSAQGTATCSSETAVSTRTLTINPLPEVDAGSDATICAANTLPVTGIQQFTSALQWTTSGDGVFINPGLLSTIYTPGANDILSGNVLLTLTGNGSGACSAVNDVDQLALTIDPMPAINAGSDAAYCVTTTPVAITGTSAVHYSSLQWITSGDGAISNPAILSPTYAPGNVDFNNGTVTLTLRAFGQLSCAAESVIDSRVLSVSAYPVINAGPDDYICSNVTQFQLNGIGNNYNLGNIQWTFTGGDGTLSNPNVINPVYNAGPIDLSTVNRIILFTLTVQGTGNCSSVIISDQVELKIDPTPVSNAGPDDETCGRNIYQLNATAQFESIIKWITSGDGTFSNTGILNPTYTPGPTDVGGTVVLTLDLAGCKSISGADFLWLTVHPDPGATIEGTTSICEGTSTDINITLTGTPPWNITYTNGTSPVTVSNILSSPYAFNVTPATTTNLWVTAANDANCTAPVDSLKGLVTVTVFPLPDKYSTTVSNNGVFCEGTVGVSIGLNNSQPGMNYELWQNGLNTGNMQPGTGNPINFGIINIPGQYYVRAINPAGNCIAMMNDTLNVIMNPIPVTDFVASTPCLGDTTIFTVSGQYISSTSFWHWTFGDGTFATFNAPSSPKHLYPAPGIYNVVLSVGDTNNCLYTVTHPVEVRPHPTSFFSYNTPNCIGSSAVFTDLSTTPDSQGYINQWIWNFGDGTPSDTIDFPASPNVVHDYLHEGTYEVTLTIMNSRNCGDTYSASITVSKRPQADFTFTTGCEDEIAVFADNSDVNGGGQIAAWSWNFGDPGSGVSNFSTLQNPVHDYSASGNYTITLIINNMNGCSDTLQKTIYVKSKPLSNFFSSPGCVNSETQFLADSTIINTEATAIYQWNFGDGETSFSQYPSHSYVAPGTYYVTLTLTDTAGCVGDTILPVIVNPPPTAHFSANTDNCQGQAVAFANQSVSNSGFITTWEWNFGDGNTQTVTFPDPPNVNHAYAGTGTFDVTLTVTNNEGCSHFETRTVNSLGAPSADYMSAGQCAGTAVAFTDLTSVSGNQTLGNWNWNFGDPTSGIDNTSISQHPEHVFATAGNYIVQLITFTGNNCSDTITKTVTVKPIPAVDFTTQSACAGNPALFAPAGLAVNTISGWFWTFGDGGSSNEQAPTHSYTSPGTFTVTLTITDTAGCSNTISKPLIIAPLPDANFSFSTPTCKDDAVSFTDFSSAITGYVARWTWDFGDGNVQNILFPANPSVTHQYANAGTFNVILTVKTNDSCTNQLTRVVTILPKPTAAFTSGAACQGNSVTFNDQSISNTTGSISGWNWNFGDPTSGTSNSSTLQHPTHIYSTAGTYTAQLIVSIQGGCSDTITHQITVSPPPSVDFTPVAGCNGDTTQFTATVNSVTTQGYYWQFGDGGTSFIANPIHVYATAGIFTVTLTITDTAGCANVKVKPVIVIPGPVAAFSSSSPGCSGLPITFTDLSNANGGTITSWYWDFGDGTDTTFTSATSSFAHTYAQPGTFAAKLTVFSAAGCENLKQQIVTISPSPLAAFDYQNTCQGQSTQFTDLTNLNGGSSLTQRIWNFGDPNSGILNTSTQTNPIHTYSQPGTYMVTLVALNGGGCVDTIQQNVSITPKPGVDFYNDSLVCFGNTITLFTDTTVANIAALDYFEWDFGDGSPHAFTQNASHQYNVAGTFTVTLSVQDTAGCENFISRPITIHANPNPQFTYLGICENAATQFTDQSLAPQGDTITSWLWEFMQGATTLGTDSVQNPNFTFNQPGTFSVKLTTFTEHGCNDTKILPVQIWNKPTAYFNYTASPCANGLVTFQDSSWSYQGLVNNWAWEFEPYQYGTGTHPSHQYYAVDSCYAVTLMIEDLRGCMDTVVQQICVPPALSVDFNTELTCFGSPVTFTPELVTPAAPADSLITFSWNFGDPTTGSNNVSTQKTPAHNFSSVGFYTVSFSTTDKFGCSASNYTTVLVNALPVANFSYTTGQCDSTLIFSSTSIDTSSTIITYIWQYGDGNSDTLATSETSHKYSMPGEYLASLTIINSNGCTATHSVTVTRSACLVAATMSIESLMCQNQTVSFADISTCDGTISQWDWNFGDGSSSESYTTFKASVTHTFTNPGPYTISLKVSTLVGTSIITDSTSMDIVVKPTPVAGFATEAVCLGVKTEFSDTTQTNGATMLYYRWEFGDEGVADTSNLRNPEYLYSVAGIYSPELIVKNEFGCADTITSNLTVNGLPDAGYANSLACAGQKTYFFDASQPYVDSLTTWGWCVDDSLSTLGYMNGATPTFTFDSTGTYHVMLTVADINGCADTLIQNVTVNPAPISAFSYTENVENIQGQVQFNNGTIGAKEYYWDFGNGTISYEDSPLITYTDDGLYNIMLVSVSNEGCHDTTLITYEMMFKGLYVPNAIAPGGTIQATRIWKPVGVNLATYTAEIYNSHGMLLWKSSLLDENGTPAESWDGTYNDKPCQQDVYVWKITAVYRDGSIWNNADVGEREGLSEPKWGTVTLIR